MTDLCGQAVAHASPSVLPLSLMAARKDKAIAAICGRSFMATSESNALQSSLASRLQARFAGGGGMTRPSTLSPRATPARRLYCELTLLEQTTRENASTGWPTPAARDGKDISRTTAYLAARKRHSPSMATRLLERGAHWTVITAIYCLAMGYPSRWNDLRPMATETPSSRKSRKPSSNQ